MATECPFCPDTIYDGGQSVNEDDLKFAIDAHMAAHEHFTFSCAICQKEQ